MANKVGHAPAEKEKDSVAQREVAAGYATASSLVCYLGHVRFYLQYILGSRTPASVNLVDIRVWPGDHTSTASDAMRMQQPAA